MKVILVDDEPKALELLKGYLSHFNEMDLVGTFRNGLKAFEFISKEKVDLVFLDINMPHISGISLSKMLPQDIKVIFTTAYSEFAAESYEVGAVDYLLKPISLERFTKAMGKVITTEASPLNIARPRTISVKSGSKTFRLCVEDILYLVKAGNYITYHFHNKKILARASIKEALDGLPNHFMQCHRSYIVNVHKILSIDKNEIAVGENIIPIGDSFKQAVSKLS